MKPARQRHPHNPNRDSQLKAEYKAMGRTYCSHCGNSDADMDIDDDICYDCLHPEEAKAQAKADRLDFYYTYGDPNDG